MKRAHVFLTNTSQFFYVPKSFDQLNDIYMLVTTGTSHELVTSVTSLRMNNSHCMLTLNRNNGHFKSTTASKACFSLLYNVVSY